MGYSFEEKIGDGITDLFSFNFPYVNPSDIFVTVNGISADFSLPSQNSVKLSSIPASGEIIRIKRNTDITEATRRFSNGSILDEQDLNRQTDQTLFVIQEFSDKIGMTLTEDDFGSLDASGRSITNLASPSSPGDAVTLAYLNDNWVTTMAGYVQRAETAAASASAVEAGNALVRDGSVSMTGNLNMDGKDIVNLGRRRSLLLIPAFGQSLSDGAHGYDFHHIHHPYAKHCFMPARADGNNDVRCGVHAGTLGQDGSLALGTLNGLTVLTPKTGFGGYGGQTILETMAWRIQDHRYQQGLDPYNICVFTLGRGGQPYTAIKRGTVPYTNLMNAITSLVGVATIVSVD